MRIAVTGGSGKIGREAIRALLAAGHSVLNFDLSPSPDGVRTVTTDLANFGETMAALSGTDHAGAQFDAVLHLASIPGPAYAPDHRVFAVNTLSTYNVFSACRRLGIGRIVWGSSETLLGQPYPADPPYVPLDEHISRPEWSYSLSKQLGEVMAEVYARWMPKASIVSLRFSNVFAPADYGLLAEIQKHPEKRKLNLWGYVDARDAGQACRLALEVAPCGHESLIIAAQDNLAGIASAELMARFFPDVPGAGNMAGCDTLLSNDKARRLIGYVPRHSWRDWVA